MGKNILQEIAAMKRIEVAAMKRIIPLEYLREQTADAGRGIISLKESIRNHRTAIIAEHKRRSPSKGEISAMNNVARIASSYADGGAAGMSVLTDTPYFGGSLTDLAVARANAPALPILRKEFIVDEYQLYQARIFGADAVLLIAAMIPAEEIARLNATAHELELETLVEIHNQEELEAVPSDADLVGVNNRDLTSFSTDINNSAKLIDSLPTDMVRIAESGIHTPEDIIRLKKVGFNGFLIGEAFMSTPNPVETLHRFISES